jgi:hypothetical protein
MEKPPGPAGFRVANKNIICDPLIGRKVGIDHFTLEVSGKNLNLRTGRKESEKLMKITSLISSESNEHALAFGTDPKMWPMVFDHFIVLARLDPTLKDFVWAVSDKSSLVLRSTGLISSVISGGFIKTLEGVLNAAEALVQKDLDARRQEEKRKQYQITELIESAATKLGIPLK